MPTHEPLLDYYRRELDYLRRMGRRFSRQYPKIAGRLELEADQCPDPHIERMIESFAFLSARVQYNLESEFPRISSALLNTVYPQFVSPTPAMAVARFMADPDQGGFTTGHPIAAGTPLFAASDQGDICRFRTCYPLTLWPMNLTYAGFEAPEAYEFLDYVANAVQVLRLHLLCPAVPLNELRPGKVRFYLNGDRMVATTLYELIFAHTVRLAAVVPVKAPAPLMLPTTAITPVGFGEDEAVLPYPPNAHRGYRLIHEYFAFPRKFFFFDLDLSSLDLTGHEVDIIFALDEIPAGDVAVENDTFALGCTPVINLFNKITDPIRITHTKSEYMLVPDSRRERITEIHSIRSVTATREGGETTVNVEPYFAFNHRMARENSRAFWCARREKTGRPETPGTQLWLSFVDLDFNPARPPGDTVFARVLCTNRVLAEQLPEGTLLQIEEAAPVLNISLLDKPTPQIDPPLDGATLWRLISHLSLNYLSLSGGKEGLEALREILMIYSAHDLMDTFRRSDIVHQIQGIREMECRQTVRRMGDDAWCGFCRGTEIALTVDESMYTGRDVFLLASVLNRFFPLYASINTFTRTVLKSLQRDGEWYAWPPMTGDRIVL